MNAFCIINPIVGASGNLVTPESVYSHRKYGITGRPIRATAAFRVGSAATASNGAVIEHWMLVNLRTNTATFVTTRNGQAGWNFDPDANSYALDFSRCLRTIQRCECVAIGDCPVAVADPLFSAVAS